MVGQTVAYVRVSSAEQNMDRQLEAVGGVRPDLPEQDLWELESQAHWADRADWVGTFVKVTW